MILLNISAVAADSTVGKNFELPLLSKPIAVTFSPTTAEVAMFIAIHHKTPWKAPNPNMPAATPMKIFEITRL